MPRAATPILAAHRTRIGRAMALLLALLTPRAAAHSQQPATALVGLWGDRRIAGSAVGGELTVRRERAAWRGEIAGYATSGTDANGEVTFVFPGGVGRFRGRLSTDGAEVRGFWIQPPRPTDGTPFATPVVLHALRQARVGTNGSTGGSTSGNANGNASGIWRGTVVPLPAYASVYMLVTAGADGSTHALVRNPERNAGGTLLYTLVLDGAQLRLNDPRTGQTRLRASYDSATRTITMRLPNLNGVPLELTRHSHDEAVGFFPRATTEATYRYRPPLALADGWTVASTSDVGFDSAKLETFVQTLIDTDTTVARVPLVQSVLIARHGALVLEEYFYGFSQDRQHDLRSAGKTFSTTLVGMAIDHGAPIRVTDRVVDFFPEYRNGFANADPRKSRITVEHLLSMHTGLACDENADVSPGTENAMQSQSDQPDWYKWTLDLPMAHDPGTFAAYCSPTINLLGGVVRNATKRWVPELFDAYLARPLDFGRYYYNLSPAGDGYMAGGLHLLPRDMLKLGQLFLNGGVWNGRRVISRAWITQATTMHAHLNNDTVDGYNWWLSDVKVGERTYKTYGAGGNGGQVVTVIPELDMVVAFTAGNYGDFVTWQKLNGQLLPQFILTAVRETTKR